MPFKNRLKDYIGRSISVINEETNEDSLSMEQINESPKDGQQNSTEDIKKGNNRFRTKSKDRGPGIKLKNLLLKNSNLFKSFEIDEDPKTLDSEIASDSQPKVSVSVQYKRYKNPKQIIRKEEQTKQCEIPKQIDSSVPNCKVQISSFKSKFPEYRFKSRSLASFEEEEEEEVDSELKSLQKSPTSKDFLEPRHFNWEDSDDDDDDDDDDVSHDAVVSDDDDDDEEEVVSITTGPYMMRTARFSEGDINAASLLNSPILNQKKLTEKRRRNSTVTWKDLKTPIKEQKPIWLRTRRNAICEELERDIQIQGLSLRQWRKIILTNFTLLDFDLRF
ncbi:probable serine/threonine-protein kinase fhkB [Actinia tenebrosa]|uniref:Probable serine/threonine-protein kinase fhkB n=1 Tax=Actinia tenebrosa TaxID=6105 RepID=A0A6P8ICE7_ACTTE|nr:probable serine/threonine-protein kinase fhkB [Actinia tenebrosa]